MVHTTYRSALIVGTGPGLSAALARRFAANGLRVALAARDTGKLDALCAETGATAYARGPLVDLDPEAVRRAVEISAFGAFLVSQHAARLMLPHQRGAILLTGATAGVKGFPLSAAFAMGKFALRGLAQSMARELSPAGIHVAHFVIDGGIRSAERPVPADRPDSLLDPDAIAETYWHVMHQHRSAWSWEIEVRPWVEKF